MPGKLKRTCNYALLDDVCSSLDVKRAEISKPTTPKLQIEDNLKKKVFKDFGY